MEHTIDIIISRTAIGWKARAESTTLQMNWNQAGQGNTREEAIGDLIRQLQNKRIIINSIAMDKHSEFTKTWCSIHGIDWEDKL